LRISLYVIDVSEEILSVSQSCFVRSWRLRQWIVETASEAEGEKREGSNNYRSQHTQALRGYSSITWIVKATCRTNANYNGALAFNIWLLIAPEQTVD